MFLLNSYRGSHQILDENYTTPKSVGLKLSFSHLGGYSPIIDGSIRVIGATVEENITVSLKVSASSVSCILSLKVASSTILIKYSFREHSRDPE